MLSGCIYKKQIWYSGSISVIIRLVSYYFILKTVRIMNGKLNLRGRIGRFVQWPLYLSILLIIFNVLVYLADIQAGLVMSLGICLYLLVAVPLARRSKPAILNELIAFAKKLDAPSP